MIYNLIYQTEFDALNSDVQPYKLLIYKKNYTGLASNVLAAGEPIVCEWDSDEVYDPIKGGKITVNLINDGSLPLSKFFSVEDDTFKCELYWGEKLIFTGFLVQDDASEIQVDQLHEIQLVFTDNIGLLKDVSFDQANKLVGRRKPHNYNIYSSIGTTDYGTEYSVLNIYGISLTDALIGDTILIEGTPADGVYTVKYVTNSPTIVFITLVEAWPNTIPAYTQATVTFITPQDLNDRVPLTKFLEICLKTTGLNIWTHLYGNLEVDGGSTGRFLEDTFLGCRTFNSGNTWDSCYSVLTKILSRFKLTLFQSDGFWNLIRWDELRYFDSLIPGTRYDVDFNFMPGDFIQQAYIGTVAFTAPHTVVLNHTGLYPSIGSLLYLFGMPDWPQYLTINDVDDTNPDSIIVTVDETIINGAVILGQYYIYIYLLKGVDLVLNKIHTYGNGSDIETGLLQTIKRPLKFDKETFNYKQPPNLLKNADLQELGDLIRYYTSGSNKIYEYELPHWNPYTDFPSPTPNKRIRIIKDASGEEIERYAVIWDATSDSARSAESEPIEVSENDIVKFSFSFRTSNSQSGSININFAVRLKDGTNDKYIKGSASTIPPTPYGSWGNGIGWNNNTPSGDNTNRWHSVEIISEPAPYGGLLYVYLAEATPNGTSSSSDETQYKNMRLELVYAVTGTTTIIGHTHTNTQPYTILNKTDDEIFIDDSPRNSIGGTLFLDSFTGYLQDRTVNWNRKNIVEQKRLGEIITFEQLFQKRVPRIKLEGTLLGLVQKGFVYKHTGELIFYHYGGLNCISVTGELIALAEGAEIVISGTQYNDGIYSMHYIGGSLPIPDSIVVNENVTDETVTATIQITYNIRHLSMLNVLKCTPYAGKNFNFGMLSIALKSNAAKATMYEAYVDGETDSDLQNNYVFKYLFETI